MASKSLERLREKARRSGRDYPVRVLVETMPDSLRECHRVANNWGVYPHNGAERRLVSEAEAAEIIASDPDEFASVVAEIHNDGILEWAGDLEIDLVWDKGTGDRRLRGFERADGARAIETNGDPVFEDNDGFAAMWRARRYVYDSPA